jgi:hypothetical protein
MTIVCLTFNRVRPPFGCLAAGSKTGRAVNATGRPTKALESPRGLNIR